MMMGWEGVYMFEPTLTNWRVGQTLPHHSTGHSQCKADTTNLSHRSQPSIWLQYLFVQQRTFLPFILTFYQILSDLILVLDLVNTSSLQRSTKYNCSADKLNFTKLR